MWKIFSVFGYLNPSYWFPGKETIPESRVRKLDPLNFEKHPELRQLQKLGARPSILRECQTGFESFKSKGLSHHLDKLREVYETLITTEGCTKEHIVLFNNLLSNYIRGKIEFALDEICEFLAKRIEAGESCLDIYTSIVPKMTSGFAQQDQDRQEPHF